MTSFLAFLAVAPAAWGNWITDNESPFERERHLAEVQALEIGAVLAGGRTLPFLPFPGESLV